jgi:hypothetical protein
LARVAETRTLEVRNADRVDSAVDEQFRSIVGNQPEAILAWFLDPESARVITMEKPCLKLVSGTFSAFA